MSPRVPMCFEAKVAAAFWTIWMGSLVLLAVWPGVVISDRQDADGRCLDDCAPYLGTVHGKRCYCDAAKTWSGAVER